MPPYRSSSDWDRPVLRRQRDPFFTRIGLLIAGIALLVPVALIVRPPADGGRRVVTDGLPGAVAVLQPGVNVSSTGSSVPPSEAAAAEAVLVPPAPEPAVVESLAPGAVEAAAVTTTTAAPTTPPTVASTPGATQEPVTVAPLTAAPTTLPCGPAYEITAGDYWTGIAAVHELTLRDLLAVNQATVDTALFPGDTICLPIGAVRRTTTTVQATTTTKAPATTAAKPAATPGPPATPAPTTAAPPSRSYAHDEIEQIIRDVFPDELEEKALQVAWRESTYRPTAKNYCCYGLFQIHWNAHKTWLDDVGVTSASQLYDPVLNAQVAVAVHQRAGGWGPWGG